MKAGLACVAEVAPIRFDDGHAMVGSPYQPVHSRTFDITKKELP